MKRCPQCQFQTAQNDELFCGNCGTRLELVPEKPVCKGCGAELKPGAKFCTKCGAKIEVSPEKASCKQNNIMEHILQGGICRFICEDCGITVLCEDITLGAECFACGRKYLKDEIIFQIQRDQGLFPNNRNNSHQQLIQLLGKYSAVANNRNAIQNEQNVAQDDSNWDEVIDPSSFHSSGAFDVYSGCSVTNTAIKSGETSYVNRGGKALRTLIKSGGRLAVLGGGFADGVIVRSGGGLTVSGGGTATNIMAEDGAKINFAIAADTVVQGTSNGKKIEMKGGR